MLAVDTLGCHLSWRGWSAPRLGESMTSGVFHLSLLASEARIQCIKQLIRTKGMSHWHTFAERKEQAKKVMQCIYMYLSIRIWLKYSAFFVCAWKHMWISGCDISYFGRWRTRKYRKENINTVLCIHLTQETVSPVSVKWSTSLRDTVSPLHTVEWVRPGWKMFGHYYLAKHKNQGSGSGPTSFKFCKFIDENLGQHPLAAGETGV